jgi:hypothetical protein
MVTKSYRAYVVARLDSDRQPKVVLSTPALCDICSGQSKKWEYGIPDLCEMHARELGLLW